MICVCCLSDGLEVRRDVKGRPYAVHSWCATRLFLKNDAVLAAMVEAQPGLAAWIARRGGAVALQAEAMEPAPPGASASSECMCVCCLTKNAAAVRIDKKGRPFSVCRACSMMAFPKHPLGMTAIRLTSPGVRAFMAAAGAGQVDTQREAAPGAAREVA